MSIRKLTCAVGIATYNRQAILKTCLSAISTQTRLPDEIIIGDASTVELDIETELQKLRSSTKLTCLKTPLGLPLQRNKILDHVKSDIIIFLDDDTIVFPEYIENIMRIYEADINDRVGGIEGFLVPNRDLSMEKSNSFQFPSFSIHSIIEWLRIKFTGSFYPNNLFTPIHAVPSNLKTYPIVAIRYLNGCVMSFRAHLAIEYRFDETLKKYALMEDFDISFRIGKDYAMLRCLDARAVHLREPSARLDSSLLAYLYMINLAYLTRSQGNLNEELKDYLSNHTKKHVQFESILGYLRKSGFKNYRGALAGREAFFKILEAPQDQFTQIYKQESEIGFEKGSF